MSNVKNEVLEILKVALSAFDFIFIIVLSVSTDVMKSSLFPWEQFPVSKI